MIGKTLAHYKIEKLLGKGGMGEVWGAEDTKLGRKVALKVLPELAADAERRRRFEREAQTIAALNHPNIVTIYSVEEAEGLHFITMELVDGQGLDELVPRDGLALGRLFELAIPIADALAAAHRHGIVHRDLKPNNIMVGADGRVKVLDFGLAKLAEPDAVDAGATHLPTVSVTQEGKIMGTVAYMSPEQAEGKPVDNRSDLFSMGIVLYEMATGQKPFTGDTPVSTITSILRDDPTSVTELKHGFPRHLGRIVRRCLAKDPERRYQTAIDLRNELEELRSEIDTGVLDLPTGVGTAPASGRRGLTIGAVLVAAAALAVAGWTLFFRDGGSPAPAAVTPPAASFRQLTSLPGPEGFPSIAPDGKSFVYFVPDEVGNGDIFLQRIDGSRPVNLTPDTPGAGDMMPAFSPDGDRIAFVSSRDGGGIFLMGAMGEGARKLTDGGWNPAWSPDGRQIAFCDEPIFEPRNRNITSAIRVVDVATGEVREVETGIDAVQPAWSPDGRHIAFWSASAGPAQRDLWIVPAEGGDPVQITDDAAVDWNPVWAPAGDALYFSSDRGGFLNLWRVALDPGSGLPVGEPVPVTAPTSWAGHLSIAADGRRMVFTVIEQRSRIDRVPFDAARGVIGAPGPVYQGTEPIDDFAVSPDGQQIALVRGGAQEDLFVIGIDGSGLTQVTDDMAKDRGPSWSPDGRIVFYSNRVGAYEAFSIRPDGGDLQALTRGSISSVWFPLVSPDGERMVYVTEKEAVLVDLTRPVTDRELTGLAMDHDGKRIWPILWWPDGRRLICADDNFEKYYTCSLDPGRSELLVESPIGVFWIEPGRLLGYVAGGGETPSEIRVLDVTTRESRALEPGALAEALEKVEIAGVELTADGTTLLYMTGTLEGDVWLVELE